MAIVVIPHQVHLLVLLGGPIGHAYGNFDLVFGCVGRGTDQHILRVIGRAPHVPGLDAHFQPLLGHAPRFAVLAHPRPALAQLAFEVIVKKRLASRLRRGNHKPKYDETEVTKFHT